VKILDDNQREIELKDADEEEVRMSDLGVNLEGEEFGVNLDSGVAAEADYESGESYEDDQDLEIDDLDSLPGLEDLDGDILDLGDDDIDL